MVVGGEEDEAALGKLDVAFGEERLWRETFDELYGTLKNALSSSEQLDPQTAETCVSIVRRVLQEKALALMKQTENRLIRYGKVRAQRPLYVPVEIKDLWGLSTLSTLIGFENEDGRHCRFFALGTRGSVSEVLHQTKSESPSLCATRAVLLGEDGGEEAFGAHPREFISYAMTISLSGRRFLENEARSLWADSIVTPLHVNRRYSEFYELWRILSKEYKFRIGASSKVRLIFVPPLPSKARLSWTSADDEHFVNERRRALEVWLRYVSLHRIMSISAPLRRFLLDTESMNDAATMDSYSVESSSRSVPAAHFNPSLSSYSRNSFVSMSKEDPIVARRAMAQVEEVLARYGSGPVALNAIHTLIPSLQSAVQSSKRAVSNLIQKEMNVSAMVEELGVGFLRYSQTNQLGGRKGVRIRMCLDPFNYLGMALKRGHEEHLSTESRALEAYHAMVHTLRLWSRHVLPQMKTHIAYLYSSDLSDSQREEDFHGVTPQERLAAEWHEMSQVRCCMFGKAAEELVQSQIALASDRRAKWEQLKNKLLRFDVDKYISQLAQQDLWASDSTTSYQDLLRQTDRSPSTSTNDGDHSFNTTFDHREALILDNQRMMLHKQTADAHINQHQHGELDRSTDSSAPNSPAPPVPRRASVPSEQQTKRHSVTFSDQVTFLEEPLSNQQSINRFDDAHDSDQEARFDDADDSDQEAHV